MAFSTLRNAVVAICLVAASGTAPAMASDVMPPRLQRDLYRALESEAQSYQKYLAYAARAEKEGLHQIATLFRAVAHTELTQHFTAHARLAGMSGEPEQMLREVTQGASYTGDLGSTEENLREAVRDEHDSLISFYAELARRAVGAGHATIVNHFLAVAADERRHRDAFQAAIPQARRYSLD